MYKVIWDSGSSAADIFMAIDEAIRDGVDVVHLSLGDDVPLYAEKGIVVICAAGNEGPITESVADMAHGVVTVAATIIDWTFPPSSQSPHLGETRSKQTIALMTEEVSIIINNLQQSGALGLIIAKNPSKVMDSFISVDFPCVLVIMKWELKSCSIFDIQGNWPCRNPQAQLRTSQSHIGIPVSTYVAMFLSRGPNSINPAVLKILFKTFN
ncbi:hypothetical protein M9H77_26309 [Catharanthus roseus]|uniref:Uncharacterized protein n=1 Tax=Catharanthus roseus TaxID=4058 RepID=A0ACC0AAA3_CATRO|nr:hypothetical protein M9H77_26309 [Catharanthus roseus]